MILMSYVDILGYIAITCVVALLAGFVLFLIFLIFTFVYTWWHG